MILNMYLVYVYLSMINILYNANELEINLLLFNKLN